MDIQQGFNRIGFSVAIAFAGLSLVCLIAASANYLEYRHNVAIAYKKHFGKSPETESALSFLNSAEENLKSWERFKGMRYRSVDRALVLAVMCIVAGVIALVFWMAVGRLYVELSKRRRRAAG